MSSHIDAIMEVVGLLRGSGKPLEDEEIVAVLLVSLPETYSGLVTALEGRDEADLTIEYVTGKMLDEYQRRIESGESEKNSEVALQSAVAVLSKGSNNNHTKDVKVKRNVKEDNKETRICFFCSKPGHIKAECRSYKKSQQRKKTSTEMKSTAVAKVGVENNQLTFSIREGARAMNARTWYVDSGATSHMTNDQTFFTELNDTDITIFLADGSAVKAKGIGEGHLMCKVTDNRTQTINLKKVLYIPQLDGGLLSVQRMIEHECRVVFNIIAALYIKDTKL